METPETPYERLLSHFGNQTAAAAALRVRPQVISNWKKRGLPKRRALEIENVTRGYVTARDILSAAPVEPIPVVN